MQADKPQAAQLTPNPEPRTFGEFLRSTPPEQYETVTELTEVGHNYSLDIARPTLELHCEQCSGLRYFDCSKQDVYPRPDEWKHGYMHYTCRNCGASRKTFALAIKADGKGAGAVYKYGEVPHFGDSLPTRVFTLIGPDKELFLQGRRAENRGLGIGALTYYRRVVENQWGRIVGEVSRVAKKVGAKQSIIDELSEVAKHTQFGRAVDSVKPALPEVLLIDGCNPLTLLHSALSEAIHDKSDQECLELAQDIRIVLADLAERSSQVMKDHAELKSAVSRLHNRGEKKSDTTEPPKTPSS